MKKILIFAYGALAYLMFLAVFIYSIGFIGNIGVENSLDSLPSQPFITALVTNLGLLSLFAVQHSVMARKWFKDWLTQYIPRSAERSTYVLFSNLAMIALFVWWQPMGGIVWQVESSLWQSVVVVVYALGWLIVLLSTFLINHFDLFGLQQIWQQLTGKQGSAPKFVTPLLYRLVRHPLYVGWIIVFWATGTMTLAHLVFAVMCTAYILIAIRFEENDLVAEFGDTYTEYQKQVPMIVPAVKPIKVNTQTKPAQA